MIRYRQFDFSGGVQSATTWLLKKANELYDVRNGIFTDTIGAVKRRLGAERVGSSYANTTEMTPTGGFIANYSTGTVRFVAVNNTAGTATEIKYQTPSTGSWTTVSGTSIDDDAQVFFFFYLDCVFVTGYQTDGTPITPFIIDNTKTVSTTLHVDEMPAAYYLAEFNGALYAANVKVGSTRYPDRMYKSSGPLGAVTFVNSAQSGALEYITVDSVRYLKTGMAIDIYTGGTDTKLYDITITSVDKVNNRIYFTGTSEDFATSAVNTSTEVITLSDATPYPTGTPIIFSSTGTVPAGLTAGVTYYSIYLTATTIKVATSEANADAGTAINLTSTGSGTHTIKLGYVLADNDEIWLDGRKGELTILWNTDYPTTETADWTATRPGADSRNEITGIAKSSNRLFFFTPNSGQKFDGVNTVVFNNSVGCASQRSIKNLDDDWLVWLDNQGRVWARNDTNAQQEFVSRQIHKTIMSYLDGDNLAEANANVFNNSYKLWLGTVDVGKGDEKLRVVYNFDDNNWSIERLGVNVLMQTTDDYTGTEKPYFYSDDGYIYLDESSNLDNTSTIPLEIETGRDNFGTEQLKKYDSMLIYSEGAVNSSIKISVDGGRYQTVGNIQGPVQYIKFPERGPGQPPLGTSVSCKILNANPGDPGKIEGIVWYYDIQEDVPSARR